MSNTPEGKAEVKIEKELEKRDWSQLTKEQTGTGYKKHVQLPNGTEADYVLYINTKPYGIIEAKRKSKDPKNHLQQARNYARDLTTEKLYDNLYSVPFIFSSNGEEIIMDDLRKGTPNIHPIRTYYSPDDIIRKCRNNTIEGIQWLKDNTHESTDKELWENQINALKELKKSIINENRKSLVTMATGSGKTRLALALTYQLLQSGYANRIIFIPDTEQLERDALNAFKSYDPIGSEKFSDNYIIRDFNEYISEGDADVVVSTIQKAHYELRENEEERSSGEFDIIIADECHRGIYNKEEGYGKVLDFFDGIEIGLTATPHEKTLKRYNHNHVFSYDYQNALDDKKVVPFSPHVISTKVTMEGIHYEGKHYTPKQFGRSVIIQDTHRKIAKEILNYTDIKNELTLVFAQNIRHAESIKKDFIKIFKKELDIEHPKEFIKVITSEQRHSQRTLEDFKDKRRNPKVAITVDMVSTGVDIRPLNNLIFLRAVKSEILYNQMIGRGTRTAPDKTHFKLFDCIGVLEYHKDTPPFNSNTVQKQNSTESNNGTTTVTEQEPKYISESDVDTIIKSSETYPLPDKFVSAEEYLYSVKKEIDNNKIEIVMSVSESQSIQQANKEIENILKSEWKYYTENFILNATNSDVDTLFEFTSELLLGYNAIRKNATKVKKDIQNNYDLSEEQKVWLDLFEERTAIEKSTISKKKLLNKPFSDYGGYDKAKKLFKENPSLDELINKYNSELLNLKN